MQPRFAAPGSAWQTPLEPHGPIPLPTGYSLALETLPDEFDPWLQTLPDLPLMASHQDSIDDQELTENIATDLAMPSQRVTPPEELPIEDLAHHSTIPTAFMTLQGLVTHVKELKQRLGSHGNQQATVDILVWAGAELQRSPQSILELTTRLREAGLPCSLQELIGRDRTLKKTARACNAWAAWTPAQRAQLMLAFGWDDRKSVEEDPVQNDPERAIVPTEHNLALQEQFPTAFMTVPELAHYLNQPPRKEIYETEGKKQRSVDIAVWAMAQLRNFRRSVADLEKTLRAAGVACCLKESIDPDGKLTDTKRVAGLFKGCTPEQANCLLRASKELPARSVDKRKVPKRAAEVESKRVRISSNEQYYQDTFEQLLQARQLIKRNKQAKWNWDDIRARTTGKLSTHQLSRLLNPEGELRAKIQSGADNPDCMPFLNWFNRPDNQTYRTQWAAEL